MLRAIRFVASCVVAMLGIVAAVVLGRCHGPKRRIAVVIPPNPDQPARWAIYYPPGSARIGFRTVDNRVLAESLLRTFPRGIHAARLKIEILNREYPDHPWKIVTLQCESPRLA